MTCVSCGDATILPAARRDIVSPTAARDFELTIAPPASPGPSRVRFADAGETIPPPNPISRLAPPADAPPSDSIEVRQAGPLRSGQQFGRYTIIRLLGIGGMGAVYQAWDEELEVAVALKVIRPEVMADPLQAQDIERRFKRELLLARQVTHRNVVRIYDLGELEGIKYITMSYEQGQDLATILRKGRMSVAEVLRILRGLVSGLAAAHDAGVVHRDLKPANILLQARTGEPLIMDFGIARAARVTGGPYPGAAVGAVAPGGLALEVAPPSTMADTSIGAVTGTVAYMAPEQARGIAVDHRADLYAVGLIAYDLLLGRRRTAGPLNPLDELKQRLDHPPPSPRSVDASIPEPIDPIVMRCLEPDPGARYQSAALLLADLEQLDATGHRLPVIRRLTARMIAGAVTAMLCLMALMYWATRPVPPMKLPDAMSILIADFEDSTNDPVFKGTLENVLGTSMEGAAFITSYARQGALRIAQQIRPGRQLDAEAARLVAVREGIKVVLAGTIESKGPAYRVTIKALDPATAKPLATATGAARSKQDVIGAITSAAVTLRGQLGDTTPASVRRAAMETVTAGSLEALDAYERGQDLARSNKLPEALEAYRRAIALDPDFGRAYAGMAVVYNDLKDEPRKNAAYEAALKHLGRMTEREKYRTLGTYYLLTARNYEKAIENYQTLLRLYPADTAGHGNLGMAYMLMGHADLAANEAREALKIYPRNLKQRYNLALYQMYAGDFDRAIRDGSNIIEETPSYAIGYYPVALSMIASGDVAGAQKIYGRLESQGAVGVALARLGRIDMAMYQGRYKEADQLVGDALAADETTANVPAQAQHYIDAAQIAVALNQPSRAVAAARKAVTLAKHESVLFPAARVLLETGHPDEARAIAKTLENMLQLHTTAYARLIDAEIFVREGRYGAAIEAFRDSIKRRDTWFARFLLGQTYAKAEHFAEAMAELDIAFKRRGEVTDVFLYDTPTLRYMPTVYYWLARSQQAMGIADARKTYERFVQLRSDADTSDPLALDARTRLGTQF
jgi:tetratricopeptide (TPR) repeat protein